MAIIYFILGGFLRRWYGGLFDDIKILSNRGLQSFFMIALMIILLIDDFTSWKKWLIGGVVVLWLQFQYWSRGHGCCFDIGRGGTPDEDTVARYNERWYHYPCDWLADKRFFSYYGLGYDFTYMFLRYTCPMLPMIYFKWEYLLIGASVAPVYAICWLWSESEVWVFNKIKGLNTAVAVAEVICGGIFYSGLYFLGGI